MKVKDYMNKREDIWELTCWDNVIDSEFYLYRKEPKEIRDPDFPNVDKCMDYLIDNLEVKEEFKNGVTVNLYEMLDNPIIIQYAKEHLYSENQYRDDSDVVELLFDAMMNNISCGYETFSKEMLTAFRMADDEKEHNSNELETFKIPVVYQSWGLVEVEAKSLQEAVKYAEDNLIELPLPDDPQYVEDSYEIDYEGIAAHNNGLMKQEEYVNESKEKVETDLGSLIQNAVAENTEPLSKKEKEQVFEEVMDKVKKKEDKELER